MATVIFDFDGTIADSFDYVFNFLWKEAGRSGKPRPEDVLSHRNLSMKSIAFKLGIPFWRLPMVYFKGRRVMRGHIMQVQPFPGMVEVITALHEQGDTLYIVSSNSARNIRRFLLLHQLNMHFTAVRGGAGMFGKSTVVHQLMRRYKFKSIDCFYVGDEISDIAAARAADIQPVMVGWGFADQDELAVAVDAVAQTPQGIIKMIHG